MFERNNRNASNTIGYTRTSAIAERPASGRHETTKMPATVWMQKTTVMPATSNIKNDNNIMTAQNSRNAGNSRNESNNRTANTVWTPSKAGMLAKTVKPATAWREDNSSRDNGNITASTAEGRPATTRMPEIVETSQQSVLASAEMPIAQFVHQQQMSFHGNMPKSKSVYCTASLPAPVHVCHLAACAAVEYLCPAAAELSIDVSVL
jgi:hypothetical protein